MQAAPRLTADLARSAMPLVAIQLNTTCYVSQALCDSMTSFQAVQHNVAGLPSEQVRTALL